MSGMVLVAFYLGLYVGGVASLWAVARVNGWPFLWSRALLWVGAWTEQLERDMCAGARPKEGK